MWQHGLVLGGVLFLTCGRPPATASHVAQQYRTRLPVRETQEMQVRSLGQEDPLEGEMTDNPLQYSCMENPMDRGAWQATVHGGRKSGIAMKRLSTHARPLLAVSSQGKRTGGKLLGRGEKEGRVSPKDTNPIMGPRPPDLM